MSRSGVFGSRERRVILFVAPDEDTLLAYRTMATAAGFESELARDAHEGVLLANLVQPDAVVVDLRRHELGGESVVRRLRAGAMTHELPIVLMGATGDAVLNGIPTAERHAYALDIGDWERLLRVLERLLSPCDPPALARVPNRADTG